MRKRGFTERGIKTQVLRYRKKNKKNTERREWTVTFLV